MGTALKSVLRLFALAAMLLPTLALADPPARVGRLAAVEGGVLFRVDRDDAGQPASLNWPISSGAILDTDPGARAEVWIGSGAFRLAGAGRLEFATIDDRLVFLQLAVGSLVVTVRDREQADNIEIRTPEGRIQFARAGRFRIDAVAGRTTVTSRAGSAYLYANGGRGYAVPEGRSAVLDGGVLSVMSSNPASCRRCAVTAPRPRYFPEIPVVGVAPVGRTEPAAATRTS